MDFQGSVVVPAVARRPPVHMLMSKSLIVSSYFNLLHSVGGKGGQEIGEVRGRDDEMRGKEMMEQEKKKGQGLVAAKEWRGGEN